MIRRWMQVVPLAGALLVAGWLVALGGAEDGEQIPAAPGNAAPPSLTGRWPAARVSTMSGRLPDGTLYTPLLYADVDVSFGAAPTPDGLAVRVVRRDGDGRVWELRRVPKDQFPQFLGFTVQAGYVYWAQEVSSGHGPVYSIWRVQLAGDFPAVQVTSDTGAGAFYDRQFDLVVADGAVHWAARADTDGPVTELRTVPVSGGAVDVRSFDGGFLLSGWPWMVSRSSATGPVVLLHVGTGQRVVVASSAAERVACTPAWCRTMAASGTGASRFDLMKPDGSQRRQIGSGVMRPATAEVALLDRFEIVSDTDGSTTHLLLYDLDDRTFTAITDGVSSVLTRQGMLWWSTGEQDVADWHAVDLRTL